MRSLTYLRIVLRISRMESNFLQVKLAPQVYCGHNVSTETTDLTVSITIAVPRLPHVYTEINYKMTWTDKTSALNNAGTQHFHLQRERTHFIR